MSGTAMTLFMALANLHYDYENAIMHVHIECLHAVQHTSLQQQLWFCAHKPCGEGYCEYVPCHTNYPVPNYNNTLCIGSDNIT